VTRDVRRVLVTGGSGFVGRTIAEALASRYEVDAPSHSALELADDDAVRGYLERTRPDAVIHSATKPGHRNAKDPTGIVEANTRMFFNLARDPDLCPCMVFIGSGAVYDERHYLPRMPEEYFDTHVPSDPHGFSKYVIAKYVETVDHVVELRAFGVFGPYEDYAIRFISNAACKALLGMPITLRQDRRLDYLWVHDLAAVVEHYMRLTGPTPAVNVTPDETVSLLELAHMVVEVTGENVPIEVGAPGMGVEYSGSNARLRAAMPDLRLTPLRQAVEELVAWYRERIDSIDGEALRVDR
jgi:UDP-glucose 4-epimerase